jgi:hypothetical protein
MNICYASFLSFFFLLFHPIFKLIFYIAIGKLKIAFYHMFTPLFRRYHSLDVLNLLHGSKSFIKRMTFCVIQCPNSAKTLSYWFKIVYSGHITVKSFWIQFPKKSLHFKHGLLFIAKQTRGPPRVYLSKL